MVLNKVAAVIVTYNPSKGFEGNIKAINKLVDETIVVDNGSNDEKINMLNDLKDRVSLIKLNENKGIAYALNRGIEYAEDKGYSWVLTLDHDSIPDEDMLKSMINTYNSLGEDEKQQIVMITPKHIEEKSTEELANEQGYEYVLTEITSGALTKTSYYRDNKYDEKLFIDLVDHDFCLAINRAGHKIIRVNNAILKHNLGESKSYNILGIKITPTNHSPVRRYYMTRNRYYIWHKYKSDFPKWVKKDKVRFISETIKIIFFEKDKINKLKMIIKGKRDYKKGIWGAYS